MELPFRPSPFLRSLHYSVSYILMSSLKSLSFLLSVVECRDGDNVPVRTRFKSGHVRSRLLDWTKEFECAKFGVNATLATAKARTNPAGQIATLYSVHKMIHFAYSK